MIKFKINHKIWEGEVQIWESVVGFFLYFEIIGFFTLWDILGTWKII